MVPADEAIEEAEALVEVGDEDLDVDSGVVAKDLDVEVITLNLNRSHIIEHRILSPAEGKKSTILKKLSKG